MKHLMIATIVLGISFGSFAQQIELSKMAGKYRIEAGMRMSPQTDFKELNGNATFEEVYSSNQIKESFALEGSESFEGIAYINYSTAHERFELIQIDQGSTQKSIIYLLGNHSDGKLKFSTKGIDNLPQWGMNPLKLKWEYTFYLDGSFKKEMLMPGKNGNYFVQSYYRYIPW